MRNICFFVLIYFAICFNNYWIFTEEIIQLSSGYIKGYPIRNNEFTTNEILAWAHLGIPYAEAPIGDLRFEKPKVKKSWKGILNTTDYGPACWQNHSISPQEKISEDCLSINVISGAKCFNKNGTKCAVIFYIHGGAYEFDSVRMFDPGIIAKNFAQNDLIFVLFGYRLGILGLWSSGSAEAPGNYAIYDMLLALKWTHREISNFGGDPKKITAIGHSTGANALALLTLIPETGGLFQQVLIMSESASKRPWLENNLKDFRTAAILVGCWPENLVWTKNLDYKPLIQCMKNKPAAQLVNVMNDLRCCDEPVTNSAEQVTNFVAKDQANVELPPRIMSPKNDGPNGLFPYSLLALQSCRRPLKVMIGNTVNEYGHLNEAFPSANPLSVMGTCDFVVPKIFFRKWKEIRQACRKNFGLFAPFHERWYSKTNFSFWTRLQTSMYQEYQYFYPMLKEVRTLMQAKSTVFLYSLDYERPGMEGIFPWHSKDLTYILGLHRNFDFQKGDHKITQILLHYIINFVKYGDPNGPGNLDNFDWPKWKPVQGLKGSNYMSLNLPRPAMKKYFHKNANWFWNEIARKIEYGIPLKYSDWKINYIPD